MTGAPLVTTYHGTFSEGVFLKRAYNGVMARGDRVVANSGFIADRISKTYGLSAPKLVTIPRGVDLGEYDPERIPKSEVEALREKWGANPTDQVVLMPGRYTGWKGQRVLIDAIASMAKKGEAENLICVMVGDSQERDGYMMELRDRISAAALVEKIILDEHSEDMPITYAAADIVVSASTDPEAFGRVAVEAQAMSKIVIATDHGGSMETIINGATGWLVAPDDSEALANGLKNALATSDAERRAMGARARARIQGNYSLSRMCSATLAVYESVLADKK
jgi:glycosyltransferase involved in cell wall biosynthesis